MTARDRKVLVVIALLGVVAAYWFLLLAPKRKEAATLSRQVATEKRSLSRLATDLTTGVAARREYARNYTTVARLGQAVPAEDDVPSLVFQLDTAAQKSGVDFRAIKLTGTSTSATTATATTSTTTPPASGSGSASPSSTTSTTTSTATPTAPSIPSEASAATLPPGATIGAAGFPTMPFSFTFDGSFFKMAKFFRRLNRFVEAGGKTVQVGGRLLTLDGISLSAGRGGFPNVKASIAATAYLVPPTQGATGSSTAAAPVAGTSASSATPAAALTTSPAP